MTIGNSDRIGAFFDVDKTIIDYNTMSGYHWYYHRNKNHEASCVKRISANIFNLLCATGKYLLFLLYALKKDDRVSVNKRYYSSLNGVDTSVYTDLIGNWYRECKILNKIYRQISEIIDFHQREGHIVVLVTGSHLPLIEPLGKALNIDHILATEVEVKGNTYTGKIKNDFPMVGDGKALAIKRFAEQNNINLSRSYAYSDHISDVQMLETVGNPCAVIGDAKLDDYARKRSWQIITT